MARHFLRLKLALLASALRRGWQAATGLLVGALVALPAAGFAGYGLAVAGARTDFGDVIVPLTFAVLAVCWVVLPPLAFGVDETLDPARMRLLPLTRRQLLVGLTAAGAVGVAPLATLLVLGGAAAGLATRSAATAVVALVAVAAQFVVCLVTARAVTTALSARLRSRKGRDLMAILGVLIGFVAAALGQVPNLLFNVADVEDNPQVIVEAFGRAADLAGLTPFGWAGRGVVAAADGRLAVALGWLGATAVLLAAVTRWWAGSLEHAMTAPATDPSDAGHDDDLFPAWVRWLPRNRLGASAARELRYAWRMPQLRAQWVALPVFGIAYVVLSAVFDWFGPRAPLGVPFLVGFSTFGALNQFGADRGAVWLLVATAGDLRADLTGKNLAAALILVPYAVVVSVAVGAVTGGWAAVAPAVLASAALVAIAYGIGDITSVLAPSPLPESASNLWAGSTGTGCASGIVQLLALLAQGVLVLPIVALVGAAVVWRPALVWPAVAVGLAYAVGIWWMGLRMAVARTRDHGPELAAALSTSR